MLDKAPDISVVIPCFRSGNSLEQLVERLLEVAQSQNWAAEVLLVHDCSTQETWSRIEALDRKHPQVIGLDLSRNVGQQFAVLCGISHSQGQCVVTMDDDLQHWPEDIPTLVSALSESNLDLVIAKVQEKKHGLFRNFASLVVRKLSNSILKLEKPIAFSSFRAIRGDVARRAAAINHPTPVVGYQLLQVTQKVANIEVEHRPRAEGNSTYSVAALVRYFSVMVFEHSLIPLQVVVFGGFIAAAVALLMGVTYTVMQLLGMIGETGFTTIVVLITFFSGLILGSLAILGNYLLRSVRQTMGAPRFFVRNMPKHRISE